MLNKSGLLLSLVALATVLNVCFAGAQGVSTFNQRDDTYRLLGLKRAKETYEMALNDYRRQEELFSKQLINQAEFERAKNILSDAEVNYQQSLLAVLFEEQFITVTEAIKYHAPDGARRVRLTIANTSGGTAEFQKLLNIDDELFQSLQPDVINNVYVSLLNDDQTIVGQPYEKKIDVLRHGEPKQIDFGLLEDLDIVTVYIIYSNGMERSMKIFLQKDATVNKVAVQSEQFSQEIELGEKASFDLSLELFSGVDKTFSLVVVNLPDQIGRFFKNPDGDARLSQIKFTESSRTKRAALEVSLPDRPTDEVPIDKPIPFYVLVMPNDKMNSALDFSKKIWTDEEVEKLDVGFVRLEMIPRGIGKLLIRAPQLYRSIEMGEPANLKMELVNEGSHRLDNIDIKVDLPLNWQKRIDPQTVLSLGVGEEALVSLDFFPSEDVSVGKYDLRVRTSAVSNNQRVNGDDKTLTVEIRASANLLGTAIVVIFIVGLVGGIVVFGVRLSKR